MSIKRRATTDLNHENWDQEEKEEKEMGSYKIAPDDILEKRIIRTAKRRFPNLGEEGKKPVFSGFGGFNKTQPSSFDFLANLTNESKPSTSATATTNSTTAANVSSNLFGNISSNSIFTSVTSTTTTKPTFGKFAMESTSVFGAPTASTTASIFTSPKTDSVTQNDNPFKTSGTSGFTLNSFNSKPAEVSNVQTSSPIFGATSLNSNNKSLFTPNTAAVQPQQLSSPSAQTTNSSKIAETEKSKDCKPNLDNGKEDEEELTKSKLAYYNKLKGLNNSVLDWIKKHVEESPLCILTPIFQGYENHLEKIHEEYENDIKEEQKKTNGSLSKKSNEESPAKSVSTPDNNSGTSPSINTTASTMPKSIFAMQTTQSSNFSFGFTSTPGTNSTSTGFSFGASSTQSTSTTTSPFVTSNATLNTNGKAPFSFGSDKPFSFNSNIQVQPTVEKSNENNEEEDEPPKVEFTPIVEENSVFDKRCKIFIKKDGNFVDKGVGTLYIKKIQDNEKHQLLVRANTNLGNVLLNLVLNSAIPTQLMGKNNVMMVCIPNPESKPPPVPILIRVKTSEEAEELLQTLNKYKE